LIHTLPLTLLIEGIVILAYSRFTRKPVGLLLVAGFPANLTTQTILWLGLEIFYKTYQPALLISEIAIWLFEGVWMQNFSNGRLSCKEAFVLSFFMNAASFGIGWFLPV